MSKDEGLHVVVRREEGITFRELKSLLVMLSNHNPDFTVGQAVLTKVFVRVGKGTDRESAGPLRSIVLTPTQIVLSSE